MQGENGNNSSEIVTPPSTPEVQNADGDTPAQPCGAYGCILEKLSSRLTFHDDLIKRVSVIITIYEVV